jgi:hypothetical protein
LIFSAIIISQINISKRKNVSNDWY